MTYWCHVQERMQQLSALPGTDSLAETESSLITQLQQPLGSAPFCRRPNCWNLLRRVRPETATHLGTIQNTAGYTVTRKPAVDPGSFRLFLPLNGRDEFHVALGGRLFY